MYTTSQLKKDSNCGQKEEKRIIIGHIGIDSLKELNTTLHFLMIFKQLVATQSVVNIKISFVVLNSSVSCRLSESRQHFLLSTINH